MVCKLCGAEEPVPKPLNEVCPHARNISLLTSDFTISNVLLDALMQALKKKESGTIALTQESVTWHENPKPSQTLNDDQRSISSSGSTRPDYRVKNNHIISPYVEKVKEGQTTRTKRSKCIVCRLNTHYFCQSCIHPYPLCPPWKGNCANSFHT